MKSSKVFVVDDDPSVQRGLSRLLRSAGLAADTFSSADEFLESGSAGSPGCLVIDLRLPGMNGLELQSALRLRGHSIPVIFISGEGNIPDSVQALKAGALDFITKPFQDSDLLAAVLEALDRDEKLRAKRAERDALMLRYQRLTPRERQVCHLVATGLLNKQIGYELGASEKTIKIHRARVMEKLAVQSVPELVRFVDTLMPRSDIAKAQTLAS